MLRCGIDVLEIERVNEGLERFGDRFMNRFFTEAERNDCDNMPHRLAARIAAKEAVAKALGTGIGTVSWKDIEIRNAASGRPILHLYNHAAQVATELGLTEWDISLSHSDELATAMCVAM
ncbi:MAG: holo-ACP synthase [Chloroflexota bacterium]